MANKPLAATAADVWKRWEMASIDAASSGKPGHGKASGGDPSGGGPSGGGGLGAKSLAARTLGAPQQVAPETPDLYAEIKRLRNAAQLSGHAEGYAAGHTQGMAAGTQEGHQAGYAAGHDAGYAAGHAAGREQAQQEATRIQALANTCVGAIASVEEEMGQAILSLAVRIAQQVLRTTLDAQPEKMLDLIRDITHVDPDNESVLTLRVNPADLDLVQQYLESDAGLNHWRLLSDVAVERGGCLAETALGNIDATLKTRWQRVTSALGHDAAADTEGA